MCVQVYTYGKRYTDGVSAGSGHSWTLAGAKTYKSIRKTLVFDMKEFKNILLNDKKTRRKVWEFQAMLFDGEVNIDDILASGKFSTV